MAVQVPLNILILLYSLFLTGIFINRVWYSFGHPVYATLQRYLLLDTWILSRAASWRCRGLLLGLLFLLLPILLLLGATCSLHAMGFVNVQSCGPLTGVYYVSKQVGLCVIIWQNISGLLASPHWLTLNKIFFDQQCWRKPTAQFSYFELPLSEHNVLRVDNTQHVMILLLVGRQIYQACESYDFYRTFRFFNETGYA